MNAEVRGIARGAGLLLPATLAGNALLLLLDFYVNGLLGNEGYGLYGAVKRVLQLAAFVVLLGMENAVIRAVATAPSASAARGAVRTALLSTVTASLAVSALLFLLAGPFAAWVDPSPGTAMVLRVGAVSLPFAAVRMVAVSAAQGWQVLWQRALVLFIAWPLAQFAGVALFAHALGMGVEGVLWGYVAAMAAGAAISMWGLRRVRPDVLLPGEGSFSGLMHVAWPLWLQGIVMSLYTWADQVLLAGIRDPEQAGIYGPVAMLAPLFGVGLGSLNQAFAPVIAAKHRAGELAELQRLYRLVTRWAVAIAVPPVVLCLVAPGAVLSLWPNGSMEAAPALRLIALSQLFGTAVGSVNYLLIMCGRQRDVLWNGIPAVLLNLGLSFALIPAYGVTGAGIANAVSFLAANGIGMGQVWRALRIHPFDRAFARPLIAAVPCALAVTAAGAWIDAPLVVLGVGGVSGGVAFAGAMAALGLDADDRAVLDAVRRKLGMA